MPIGVYIKSELHRKNLSLVLKGRKSPFKGIPRSEETKRKISLANKGKWSWNKGIDNRILYRCLYCNKKFLDFLSNHRKFCSRKCRNLDYKKRFIEKGNPCWRGGRTPLDKRLWNKIKDTEQYKNWHRKVLIRDDYICQKCGHKFINLIVHHIKSFSKYKKLWFIVNNGLTLCRSCHIKIHRLKSVIYQKEIANA